MRTYAMRPKGPARTSTRSRRACAATSSACRRASAAQPASRTSRAVEAARAFIKPTVSQPARGKKRAGHRPAPKGRIFGSELVARLQQRRVADVLVLDLRVVAQHHLVGLVDGREG